MMLTVPVPVNTEAGTKVTLQTCLDTYFAEYTVDDLQCGVCQKKTTWTQSRRFKTFPKHLVVVLQRFVLDNWTAKKLEIDLTFNVDEDFDFEKMKSKGP